VHSMKKEDAAWERSRIMMIDRWPVDIRRAFSDQKRWISGV